MLYAQGDTLCDFPSLSLEADKEEICSYEWVNLRVNISQPELYWKSSTN